MGSAWRAYCSGQLIPDTTLSFFFGPSWRQPTVELMGSNPVVPMHQEMADIALGFLSSSVAHGRYPFSFQAAEHALHRRVDAPMSTDVPRFVQIGQNQRVQVSNDVALQTSLNFLG